MLYVMRSFWTRSDLKSVMTSIMKVACPKHKNYGIVHSFGFTFWLMLIALSISLQGEMFYCFLLQYSRCVRSLRHIYIFVSVNRECLNWVFELIGQSWGVINQLEWGRATVSLTALDSLRLSVEEWNERRKCREIE